MPSINYDDIEFASTLNIGRGELHGMRRVFEFSNPQHLCSSYEGEVALFRNEQVPVIPHHHYASGRLLRTFGFTSW